MMGSYQYEESRTSKRNNSRQSLTSDITDEKIKKILYMHPTLENAKVLLQHIKRSIFETRDQLRRTPKFVLRVHDNIMLIHDYNCKLEEVRGRYYLDGSFKELILFYIKLELGVLKNTEYNNDNYYYNLEQRILTLLKTVFVRCSTNTQEIWTMILNLLIEIPYDVPEYFNQIIEHVKANIYQSSSIFSPLENMKRPSQLTCYSKESTSETQNSFTPFSRYPASDTKDLGDVIIILDENDTGQRATNTKLKGKFPLKRERWRNPIQNEPNDTGQGSSRLKNGMLQHSIQPNGVNLQSANAPKPYRQSKSKKQDEQDDDVLLISDESCDSQIISAHVRPLNKHLPQNIFHRPFSRNNYLLEANPVPNDVIDLSEDLSDSNEPEQIDATNKHLTDSNKTQSENVQTCVNSVNNVSDSICESANVISDSNRTTLVQSSAPLTSEVSIPGISKQIEHWINTNIGQITIQEGPDKVVIHLLKHSDMTSSEQETRSSSTDCKVISETNIKTNEVLNKTQKHSNVRDNTEDTIEINSDTIINDKLTSPNTYYRSTDKEELTIFDCNKNKNLLRVRRDLHQIPKSLLLEHTNKNTGAPSSSFLSEVIKQPIKQFQKSELGKVGENKLLEGSNLQAQISKQNEVELPKSMKSSDSTNSAYQIQNSVDDSLFQSVIPDVSNLKRTPICTVSEIQAETDNLESKTGREELIHPSDGEHTNDNVDEITVQELNHISADTDSSITDLDSISLLDTSNEIIDMEVEISSRIASAQITEEQASHSRDLDIVEIVPNTNKTCSTSLKDNEEAIINHSTSLEISTINILSNIQDTGKSNNVEIQTRFPEQKQSSNSLPESVIENIDHSHHTPNIVTSKNIEISKKPGVASLPIPVAIQKGISTISDKEYTPEQELNHGYKEILSSESEKKDVVTESETCIDHNTKISFDNVPTTTPVSELNDIVTTNKELTDNGPKIDFPALTEDNTLSGNETSIESRTYDSDQPKSNENVADIPNFISQKMPFHAQENEGICNQTLTEQCNSKNETISDHESDNQNILKDLQVSELESNNPDQTPPISEDLGNNTLLHSQGLINEIICSSSCDQNVPKKDECIPNSKINKKDIDLGNNKTKVNAEVITPFIHPTKDCSSEFLSAEVNEKIYMTSNIQIEKNTVEYDGEYADTFNRDTESNIKNIKENSTLSDSISVVNEHDTETYSVENLNNIAKLNDLKVSNNPDKCYDKDIGQNSADVTSITSEIVFNTSTDPTRQELQITEESYASSDQSNSSNNNLSLRNKDLEITKDNDLSDLSTHGINENLDGNVCPDKSNHREAINCDVAVSSSIHNNDLNNKTEASVIESNEKLNIMDKPVNEVLPISSESNLSPDYNNALGGVNKPTELNNLTPNINIDTSLNHGGIINNEEDVNKHDIVQLVLDELLDNVFCYEKNAAGKVTNQENTLEFKSPEDINDDISCRHGEKADNISINCNRNEEIEEEHEKIVEIYKDPVESEDTDNFHKEITTARQPYNGLINNSRALQCEEEELVIRNQLCDDALNNAILPHCEELLINNTTIQPTEPLTNDAHKYPQEFQDLAEILAENEKAKCDIIADTGNLTFEKNSSISDKVQIGDKCISENDENITGTTIPEVNTEPMKSQINKSNTLNSLEEVTISKNDAGRSSNEAANDKQCALIPDKYHYENPTKLLTDVKREHTTGYAAGSPLNLAMPKDTEEDQIANVAIEAPTADKFKEAFKEDTAVENYDFSSTTVSRLTNNIHEGSTGITPLQMSPIGDEIEENKGICLLAATASCQPKIPVPESSSFLKFPKNYISYKVYQSIESCDQESSQLYNSEATDGSDSDGRLLIDSCIGTTSEHFEEAEHSNNLVPPRVINGEVSLPIQDYLEITLNTTSNKNQVREMTSPRPKQKTKAQMKQLPPTPPLLTSSDSDDNVPLTQRMLSRRTPSPRKGRPRQNTPRSKLDYTKITEDSDRLKIDQQNMLKKPGRKPKEKNTNCEYRSKLRSRSGSEIITDTPNTVMLDCVELKEEDSSNYLSKLRRRSGSAVDDHDIIPKAVESVVPVIEKTKASISLKNKNPVSKPLEVTPVPVDISLKKKRGRKPKNILHITTDPLDTVNKLEKKKPGRKPTKKTELELNQTGNHIAEINNQIVSPTKTVVNTSFEPNIYPVIVPTISPSTTPKDRYKQALKAQRNALTNPEVHETPLPLKWKTRFFTKSKNTIKETIDKLQPRLGGNGIDGTDPLDVSISSTTGQTTIKPNTNQIIEHFNASEVDVVNVNTVDTVTPCQEFAVVHTECPENVKIDNEIPIANEIEVQECSHVTDDIQKSHNVQCINSEVSLNDPSDSDLVSIAQEAAKSAYEDFDNQSIDCYDSKIGNDHYFEVTNNSLTEKHNDILVTTSAPDNEEEILISTYIDNPKVADTQLPKDDIGTDGVIAEEPTCIEEAALDLEKNLPEETADDLSSNEVKPTCESTWQEVQFEQDYEIPEISQNLTIESTENIKTDEISVDILQHDTKQPIDTDIEALCHQVAIQEETIISSCEKSSFLTGEKEIPEAIKLAEENIPENYVHNESSPQNIFDSTVANRTQFTEETNQLKENKDHINDPESQKGKNTTKSSAIEHSYLTPKRDSEEIKHLEPDVKTNLLSSKDDQLVEKPCDDIKTNLHDLSDAKPDVNVHENTIASTSAYDTNIVQPQPVENEFNADKTEENYTRNDKEEDHKEKSEAKSDTKVLKDGNESESLSKKEDDKIIRDNNENTSKKKEKNNRNKHRSKERKHTGKEKKNIKSEDNSVSVKKKSEKENKKDTKSNKKEDISIENKKPFLEKDQKKVNLTSDLTSHLEGPALNSKKNKESGSGQKNKKKEKLHEGVKSNEVESDKKRKSDKSEKKDAGKVTEKGKEHKKTSKNQQDAKSTKENKGGINSTIEDKNKNREPEIKKKKKDEKESTLKSGEAKSVNENNLCISSTIEDQDRSKEPELKRRKKDVKEDALKSTVKKSLKPDDSNLHDKSKENTPSLLKELKSLNTNVETQEHSSKSKDGSKSIKTEDHSSRTRRYQEKNKLSGKISERRTISADKIKVYDKKDDSDISKDKNKNDKRERNKKGKKDHKHRSESRSTVAKTESVDKKHDKSEESKNPKDVERVNKITSEKTKISINRKVVNHKVAINSGNKVTINELYVRLDRNSLEKKAPSNLLSEESTKNTSKIVSFTSEDKIHSANVKQLATVETSLVSESKIHSAIKETVSDNKRKIVQLDSDEVSKINSVTSEGNSYSVSEKIEPINNKRKSVEPLDSVEDVIESTPPSNHKKRKIMLHNDSPIEDNSTKINNTNIQEDTTILSSVEGDERPVGIQNSVLNVELIDNDNIHNTPEHCFQDVRISAEIEVQSENVLLEEHITLDNEIILSDTGDEHVDKNENECVVEEVKMSQPEPNESSIFKESIKPNEESSLMERVVQEHIENNSEDNVNGMLNDKSEISLMEPNQFGQEHIENNSEDNVNGILNDKSEISLIEPNQFGQEHIENKSEPSVNGMLNDKSEISLMEPNQFGQEHIENKSEDSVNGMLNDKSEISLMEPNQFGQEHIENNSEDNVNGMLNDKPEISLRETNQLGQEHIENKSEDNVNGMLKDKPEMSLMETTQFGQEHIENNSEDNVNIMLNDKPEISLRETNQLGQEHIENKSEDNVNGMLKDKPEMSLMETNQLGQEQFENKSEDNVNGMLNDKPEISLMETNQLGQDHIENKLEDNVNEMLNNKPEISLMETNQLGQEHIENKSEDVNGMLNDKPEEEISCAGDVSEGSYIEPCNTVSHSEDIIVESFTDKPKAEISYSSEMCEVCHSEKQHDAESHPVEAELKMETDPNISNSEVIIYQEEVIEISSDDIENQVDIDDVQKNKRKRILSMDGTITDADNIKRLKIDPVVFKCDQQFNEVHNTETQHSESVEIQNMDESIQIENHIESVIEGSSMEDPDFIEMVPSSDNSKLPVKSQLDNNIFAQKGNTNNMEELESPEILTKSVTLDMPSAECNTEKIDFQSSTTDINEVQNKDDTINQVNENEKQLINDSELISTEKYQSVIDNLPTNSSPLITGNNIEIKVTNINKQFEEQSLLHADAVKSSVESNIEIQPTNIESASNVVLSAEITDIGELTTLNTDIQPDFVPSDNSAVDSITDNINTDNSQPIKNNATVTSEQVINKKPQAECISMENNERETKLSCEQREIIDDGPLSVNTDHPTNSIEELTETGNIPSNEQCQYLQDKSSPNMSPAERVGTCYRNPSPPTNTEEMDSCKNYQEKADDLYLFNIGTDIQKIPILPDFIVNRDDAFLALDRSEMDVTTFFENKTQLFNNTPSDSFDPAISTGSNSSTYCTLSTVNSDNSHKTNKSVSVENKNLNASVNNQYQVEISCQDNLQKLASSFFSAPLKHSFIDNSLSSQPDSELKITSNIVQVLSDGSATKPSDDSCSSTHQLTTETELCYDELLDDCKSYIESENVLAKYMLKKSTQKDINTSDNSLGDKGNISLSGHNTNNKVTNGSSQTSDHTYMMNLLFTSQQESPDISSEFGLDQPESNLLELIGTETTSGEVLPELELTFNSASSSILGDSNSFPTENEWTFCETTGNPTEILQNLDGSCKVVVKHQPQLSYSNFYSDFSSLVPEMCDNNFTPCPGNDRPKADDKKPIDVIDFLTPKENPLKKIRLQKTIVNSDIKKRAIKRPRGKKPSPKSVDNFTIPQRNWTRTKVPTISPTSKRLTMERDDIHNIEKLQNQLPKNSKIVGVITTQNNENLPQLVPLTLGITTRSGSKNVTKESSWQVTPATQSIYINAVKVKPDISKVETSTADQTQNSPREDQISEDKLTAKSEKMSSTAARTQPANLKSVGVAKLDVKGKTVLLKLPKIYTSSSSDVQKANSIGTNTSATKSANAAKNPPKKTVRLKPIHSSESFICNTRLGSKRLQEILKESVVTQDVKKPEAVKPTVNNMNEVFDSLFRKGVINRNFKTKISNHNKLKETTTKAPIKETLEPKSDLRPSETLSKSVEKSQNHIGLSSNSWSPFTPPSESSSSPKNNSTLNTSSNNDQFLWLEDIKCKMDSQLLVLPTVSTNSAYSK